MLFRSPEEEAAQKAYWDRYGLKDENGNVIPGGFNEALMRQDYEALRNRYGNESFLKAFVSLAAPLVLMAVPGIGQMVGSAILGPLGITSTTASALLGNTIINTVLNGGDLKKAVAGSVGTWAGVQVGDIVGGAAAKFFDSASAGKFIGDIASATTRAAVTGGNIEQAALGAATSGALNFVTSKIPGFDSLPNSVKSTITGSISAAMQGKNVDVGQMLSNAVKDGFLSYGLSQIPGFKDTSPQLQDRKSTRLNSSHVSESRMPSSA